MLRCSAARTAVLAAGGRGFALHPLDDEDLPALNSGRHEEVSAHLTRVALAARRAETELPRDGLRAERQDLGRVRELFGVFRVEGRRDGPGRHREFGTRGQGEGRRGRNHW